LWLLRGQFWCTSVIKMMARTRHSADPTIFGKRFYGFKHTAGRSHWWRHHWSMRCCRPLLVVDLAHVDLFDQGRAGGTRSWYRCRREIEASSKCASTPVGSWMWGEMKGWLETGSLVIVVLALTSHNICSPRTSFLRAIQKSFELWLQSGWILTLCQSGRGNSQ
jgi:hypothetical protein